MARDLAISKIRITNLAERPREIRCFFHHDFRIPGNDVGDTAFYSPEACGQTMHPRARRSDRRIVVVQA